MPGTPGIARLIGALLILWGAWNLWGVMNDRLWTLALPLRADYPPLFRSYATDQVIVPAVMCVVGLALVLAGIALRRAARWARSAALAAVCAALLCKLAASGALRVLWPLPDSGASAFATLGRWLAMVCDLLPPALAALFLGAPEVRALWPDPPPPAPMLKTAQYPYGEESVLRLKPLALPARVVRALSGMTDALWRRLPALPAVTLFLALFLLVSAANILSVFTDLGSALPPPDPDQPTPWRALALTSTALSALIALLFLLAGIALLRRARWGRPLAAAGLALAVVMSVLAMLVLPVMSLDEFAGGLPVWAQGIPLSNACIDPLLGALLYVVLFRALRRTPVEAVEVRPCR